MSSSEIDSPHDLPPGTPPGNDLIQIPQVLPAMLLNDVLIYPNTIIPLSVSSEPLVKLVNDSLASHRQLAVFTRIPEPPSEEPEEQFYKVGTACRILKMFRVPDGSMRILVQGLIRIRRLEIINKEPYLTLRIESIEQEQNKTIKIEALMRQLVKDFTRYAEDQSIPEEIRIAVFNISEPGPLADIIASNLSIGLSEKQAILEATDLVERLTLVTVHLAREMKLINIGSEIRDRVEGELEDSQREYYLREQLKAIKKELGEEGESAADIAEFARKVEESHMPAQAAEAAKKELERMRLMTPSSAEYTVSRSYVEWLVTLPWEVSSDDELNLKKAEARLNKDHYGLDDVKTRILEFLAVRKLKQTKRGPILCFVGPPGVGKTSLGRSIAGAMGREFIRMSLGGMRDEAEIRGHRRTYVGALPGRIIQSIKRVGVNNPVMMLDEIDKLGSDFRGDPASAMLEVLDPEQNNSFQDHYLDIEFDLSRVFFITTANDISMIPGPLRDRMEIIEIPSYITDEKVQIAKKYLVPRQIDECGLKRSNIAFSLTGIRAIVRNYTREAGVRKLEQKIAGVCRKIARNVAAGKKAKVTITNHTVATYLGPPVYQDDDMPTIPRVGIALGLAWTPVGGETLIIESTWMPGKGNLIVTGQLGDVMKESARIALSYLRANAELYGFDLAKLGDRDLHIHIPEGATPKDGPSAGVTLTTSLASLFSGKKVRVDICMTGEVTLTGNVLPVGGIREKIVAARRYGINNIIMPEANEKDLYFVPDHIKKQLKFHFVKTVDEVLKIAFADDAKHKTRARVKRLG
ncbi:endopeptidase La [bacterium]|nr:endopeptidase La [bacterium]MBU1636123.1 endopeptidase La [bacterium]